MNKIKITPANYIYHMYLSKNKVDIVSMSLINMSFKITDKIQLLMNKIDKKCSKVHKIYLDKFLMSITKIHKIKNHNIRKKKAIEISNSKEFIDYSECIKNKCIKEYVKMIKLNDNSYNTVFKKIINLKNNKYDKLLKNFKKDKINNKVLITFNNKFNTKLSLEELKNYYKDGIKNINEAKKYNNEFKIHVNNENKKIRKYNKITDKLLKEKNYIEYIKYRTLYYIVNVY